ncbi:hypothetical protein SARC_04020 [Sphaeroforma arctica JP610]|uniref:Uncharacterized protein n=1 Tax=Sphaeroforma arctica JP610 TaxID=667725 RepID=A0A0L0G3Q7_9EUKA|nr:hypothetical protein SARC_04020 [Sphaeroforma arctica JP610]KNC83742.1 hypothetical protein SARC_04020 [Sphaeroforma arctica JP610]|eukprot:XP_014157644.1 hypothetical protein SARC_04020 [Sphaeroforma arctica JP610]
MSSLPTPGFTSPPTSDDDLLDIPIAHPHARNSTLHVGTPDDAHSRTHSAHVRKRKQKLVVFEDEMEGSDAQASSMTSSIRRLSVNSAEIVLQVDPFMQGGAPLRRTHSNERPKVVEKYVAIQSLRSPTVLSAQALVRSNEGEYGRMLENPVTMESVVFENVLHAHKDDEDDAWEQHETEEPSINMEDQSILQEVFYFDYGVVVMWGLNSEQQRAELDMLHAFQSDSLDKDSQNALAFDIVVDPKVAQRVADGVIFMHDMEVHLHRASVCLCACMFLCV